MHKLSPFAGLHCETNYWELSFISPFYRLDFDANSHIEESSADLFWIGGITIIAVLIGMLVIATIVRSQDRRCKRYLAHIHSGIRKNVPVIAGT